MITTTDVKTILAALLATYPNFKIAQQSEQIWQAILRNHEAEDVFNALAHYVSAAHDFPPTPGHLNQIVIERKKTAQGLLTAGEAWDMAVFHCCKPGGYDPASLKDYPRVAAAVRQVGQHRIRFTQYDELQFVTRDFTRIYNEMKDRDENLAHAMSITTGQKLLGGTAQKSLGDK